MIAAQLENAKKKIQDAKKNGKSVLLVCEKKMYADEIKKLGEKYDVSYLAHKAPGGFVTNFDTFKARIGSMNKMSEFIDTEAFESLTKKEQMIHKRKLTRAKKVYEGVKSLSANPDLVIVVDGSTMENFIREVNAKENINTIIKRPKI